MEKMTQRGLLRRRVLVAVAAIALLLASLLPAFVSGGMVSAAQLTERKITLSSSKVGQTSVTYAASFKVASTTSILGIALEICQNSPLIGQSCTTTNGVTNTPTSGTIGVSKNGGAAVNFTVDVDTVGTDSSSTGRLLLTHATGITGLVAGDTITFSFSATNPSGTASTVGAAGTFYGRFVTYATEADLDTYTSASPGTHIDDGGVALSTAKQLTVNARVQEQLEFCVGSIAGTIDTDAEAPANCSDAVFTGGTNDNTVDIGVVDSTAAAISPVAATSGGDDQNGAIMIRTNAVNGAVVSYFAEQNNSSGALKVPGASCSPPSTTDQCFNSAGATITSFATAGEKFGMTIGTVLRPTGSSTTNLVETPNYNGDGTAATGFAWVDTGPSSPTTIATSSNTVLDYEMLVLRFAARAAATTPTGSYTVTSTYIATSTF
jgi:hypothetical protein